jgi:hypothetical protein
MMPAAIAFERPARPEALQAYVDSSRTWDTLMSLAGGLRYAGNAANPRPMENESLDDLRDKLEASTGGVRKQVPEALWLVFWNARFRVPLDKGMSLPAGQLWQVLADGDTVLLSDGVTHHYSRVGHLDREARTIGFSDQWPDEFFLQSGRNVLGIAARGCIVSQDDFAKVAVGFLTWHTTALLRSCLQAFNASDALAHLRAGHAVMAAGPEYLGVHAAPLFLKAMDLADAAGDAALARNAAARAYLALRCGASAIAQRADAPAMAALQAMAQATRRHGDAQALWNELTPGELCRFSHNLLAAGMPEAAARAAEVAFAKDASWEDAYRLRAVALTRIDPAAAIGAAQRALELNAAELERLRAEEKRLGSPPPAVVSTNTLRLRRAEQRRIQGVETLMAAASNAGDLPLARAAVAELCELRPDDPPTLYKRLVMEKLLGSPAEIRAAATRLLSSNPPPELKAEAEAALK